MKKLISGNTDQPEAKEVQRKQKTSALFFPPLPLQTFNIHTAVTLTTVTTNRKSMHIDREVAQHSDAALGLWILTARV